LHSSTENLVFLAGKKAFIRIRKEGLKPEMVKVIAGAAGGPKWLVLNHLDRVIFSSWFKMRTKPLFLLGSSIGAWRFAAASQNNHKKAIDRFQSGYHNGEHAQEYKEWAERAENFGSKEAVSKINAAVEEMSAVNNHLLDALKLFGGPLKHHHEDHDHSHHHH